MSASAGWTSAPPGSASLNANVSVSASGQANPGSYPISYLIIWAQSPSGTWTPVATGTGTNSATINNNGSKTLDAAGTWNWQLRLATSGPSGSPNGTLLASATTSVAAPPTSTSFSFSNLSFTYDGSAKTASVTPNPGNATYTADLTKGPGVGSYTVSATATGSFSGSGSATLTINAAPDTSAPSTPGNVHVTTFDQNSVSFAWNASSDNVGVTGYQVRLNQGSPVTASGLTYTFSGLVNNTNYLLEVRAGDAAGNWSGWGGATASTGGSGGGGSGSGTSMWLDVNGDGIRDEVVKAGTSDFNYTIDWWYSNDPATWGLSINSFWVFGNIFNPDGGTSHLNHINVWYGQANMGTATTVTFGLTFTIAPRPGRQMSLFMDPSHSGTANPAIWQPLQQNMGPIGQTTFTYAQPFSTVDALDGTSFFLAHLGKPLAGVQVSTSSGQVGPVTSGGTIAATLPASGQIILDPKDIAGAVGSDNPQILWDVVDTISGAVVRAAEHLAQVVFSQPGVFRVGIKQGDGPTIPFFIIITNPGSPAPIAFKTYLNSESGPIRAHFRNITSRQNESGFYGAEWKKVQSNVWELGQTINLIDYLVGSDDSGTRSYLETNVKWKVNGAEQTTHQISIGSIPDPNSHSRINVEVVRKSDSQVIDRLILTIVPQSTKTAFDAWYATESTTAGKAWLSELPAMPTHLEYSPLLSPDRNFNPRLYQNPTSENTRFHPDMYFELRSYKTVGGQGHQVSFGSAGGLILTGVSAGTADRKAPYYFPGNMDIESHVDADVTPFVWALQLDGNPADRPSFSSNLDAPMLHEGIFIKKYIECRPPVPNSKPQFIPGSIP